MSEERELLAASLGRLFADRAVRRATSAGNGVLDTELWAQVASLGLPSLLIPEADGGSGGGFQEAHGSRVDVAEAIVTLLIGRCRS